MFEIKLFDIRFGISFSFFAVTALIFLCGDALLSNIIMALFCCFFHELGHIVFMILFSDKPEKIVIYGGGIRITPKSTKLNAQYKDIIILLAGCVFNFAAAGFIFAFCGLNFLCEVNLMLGVFNILPFKYFDGGRVLKLILAENKIYDFIRAFFIFLGVICIILMNVNGVVNISFMLTFIFVILAEFLW